jgi:hypothetical protein
MIIIITALPCCGAEAEKENNAMPRLSNQSAAVLEAEDLTAYGPTRATVQGAPLSREELRKIDAYWRASLYLCLGMLYLKDNPLIKEPLRGEHTKERLLGHWGSVAAQCFTKGRLVPELQSLAPTRGR